MNFNLGPFWACPTSRRSWLVISVTLHEGSINLGRCRVRFVLNCGRIVLSGCFADARLLGLFCQ